MFCLDKCLGEGIGFPETGITGSFEQPYVCWELNLGPLEETPVFLSADLSLQIFCYCLRQDLTLAQASFRMILLSQPAKCWDSRLDPI